MKRIACAAIICLILASCSSHKCTNSNPLFNTYFPSDNEYKEELIRQIKTAPPGSVHYHIDKFMELNGKPFMNVTVTGDHLCAQTLIDIANPNKLKQFKNVRGIGYSGMEIKGMQFAIDTLNGTYNFVFEEGAPGF